MFKVSIFQLVHVSITAWSSRPGLGSETSLEVLREPELLKRYWCWGVCFFAFFFLLHLSLKFIVPKYFIGEGEIGWRKHINVWKLLGLFSLASCFKGYDIKFCPLLYIYPEATEKLMINVDRSFSIKHFLHLMRKFCWLGKYWIVSLYLLILFDTKISSNFEKLVPTLGNF